MGFVDYNSTSLYCEMYIYKYIRLVYRYNDIRNIRIEILKCCDFIHLYEHLCMTIPGEM